MLFTTILARLVCYPQYSSDGCITCHSHDPNIDCGYCGSVMSCLPGDSLGSFDKRCDNNTWHYSSSYCTDEFCSSFTSKRDCKYPCAYSRIKGCIYNIEYHNYTSQMTLIALIIVCILSFIILLIVIIWAYCFWKKYNCSDVCHDMLTQKYVLIPTEQIEQMKHINLNDIPSPQFLNVEEYSDQ